MPDLSRRGIYSIQHGRDDLRGGVAIRVYVDRLGHARPRRTRVDTTCRPRTPRVGAHDLEPVGSGNSSRRIPAPFPRPRANTAFPPPHISAELAQRLARQKG